ncbi:MAG: MFS transporter [Betaproteobacteria bacterium]|nr:MAG: MFS transporter [Betaproteobacteria bacterium]
MTRSTVWRLVPALGVTQIISWGTLYYSIAVLGASIREELGISSAALFGAYSLSLLLSALVAPLAGRAIDRYGGRTVMSFGSATAAVALFCIARVYSPFALYAAWALAGFAMALTMYDAAFATLSQHSGSRYRTALTALTLMGGLASTVFWPTSLKGLEWFGWRDTMMFFAALQVAVCLPLHLLLVPRPASPDGSGRAGATPEAGTLSMRSRRGAFIALAIAFALNGFIVSVLTIHLITVLQGKGLALETAVWVGSFFGPMQVTGRIIEFSFGRRFSSRTIGMAALWLLVAALVVLIAQRGSVALALVFAVMFGFSNGVVTIVRGTVPAELFGRAGYGSTLGNLAAPALFARAVAPFAFAPLAVPDTSSFGWLLILLVMAVASVASFSIAVRRR